MGFLVLIGILGVVSIIFGPQLWVKHVIKKHGVDRPDLPGTGGELARHLIDHHQLTGVGVELTETGDHYDPDSRTVRLSHDNYHGKSLSAVAIAAHEVSHAIQHMRGDRLLATRQTLAKLLIWTDRFAGIFFALAPLLAIVARAPAALFFLGAVGFGLMGLRVLVTLITLPVEIDASFKKALPILDQGQYLDENDLPAARSVLKAAALTYVAAALISLIDVIRLMRFGR